MNFTRFLDIQSWWEVPSIAYFCSLFRTAFNLLDFDIEELEEALLTDGTEESACSLLTELIVRLLNGCLGNNDISAFNYQMYLRRLFRRKCQETGRCNPFNTDIDFQFLPLRTKVEILYALCDFRLDAEDVYDLFKNLEAESLRVEPLGWDDNDSAYWYFYGTRLYREDIIKKHKGKGKKKKPKESRKKGWFYGDDWLDDDESERVWQVVCFTEDDWTHLTEKFSEATSKVEKELYRSLSQNFLPEIPRLFQEKERLQRKRLLEAPRRTSSRVLQKIKQKEDETKPSTHDIKEQKDRKVTPNVARENRAKRRNLIRLKSLNSDSAESTSSQRVKEEMPENAQKKTKDKKKEKRSSTVTKAEAPPEPLVKAGRKTNNSLASATGQIVIPDNDEPVSSTRKKLKTSQIFSQTEEDIQTDMYKVLEQLSAHEDAWPFLDPVEEDYAPNYYSVIRRPMDLRKMEERLDNGYYTDFSMFKADFKLIVNNCRLYNGQDNEYTKMVDNLQIAFDKLTEKYIARISSSDEEIAVEYPLPTPSRKHKLKPSESPDRHRKKKRKSHSDSGDPQSHSSEKADEVREEKPNNVESTVPEIVTVESQSSVTNHKKSHHKKKDGKVKKGKDKKRKSHHHRHGKHSKNRKRDSRKADGEYSKSKHSKKQKSKHRDKDGKKLKQKKKKSKHHDVELKEIIPKPRDEESVESSSRSRSASPLPSIHTPTPSPSAPEPVPDPELIKDKYDKIKERRRHTTKEAWESLFDYKQKIDAHRQSLHTPGKAKNQKLRETIAKLKAKNEKYKETIFNKIYTPSHSSSVRAGEMSNIKKHANNGVTEEPVEKRKGKSTGKKGHKKSTTKNESASEALEQVVKDISKWLEDGPKTSTVSSPNDSPAQTISTEEHDNSRLDDELSSGEKALPMRKDINRKRTSSREPKLLKRREIQRTIDRLQPGKSKGNLLSNISIKNQEKPEEATPIGPLNKVRDSSKLEESSPKLSLGSVLPAVEFAIGNDHNFGNSEDNKIEDIKDTKVSDCDKEEKEETETIKKTVDASVQSNKMDVEVETEPIVTKPSQEKATPNLSAWFKAFGAPKSTTSTLTTTSVVVKRKPEEIEVIEKPHQVINPEQKATSPKSNVKFDSPKDPETPNPEGGDSPLLNVITTSRQRRTSTGSSMSERSSFSQDLDSPRHQMSHTSPLLRSPASPRTEDFQKISYPIINGTVRAGFYQDTTSMKSSPDKSCSPREAPLSPYSPYAQHVYAINSGADSATPSYYMEHNKSPLPTYTHSQPQIYDAPKISVASKQGRAHEENTRVIPDSYPQNHYSGPLSAYSPYPQSSSGYAQTQQTLPRTTTTNTNSANATSVITDTKANFFPVKKRMYNEPETPVCSTAKPIENKVAGEVQNKNEYQKLAQPIQTMTSLPNVTSVNEIALALNEKSELAKMNSLREKSTSEYIERHAEIREPVKCVNNESVYNKNDENIADSNKPVGMTKHNVDMINIYMNPEMDRRNNVEAHSFQVEKNIPKVNVSAQQRAYEIETIAINLGMNNHNPPAHSSISKPTSIPSNIPAAHSQERTHIDLNPNQNIPYAHNNQFENRPRHPLGGVYYPAPETHVGSASHHSKFHGHNQGRKPEVLPYAYTPSYSNNAENLKADVSSANVINYNKPSQTQNYNAYNTPRTCINRTQETQQNLPAELRIPNPRGLIKIDHSNIPSSLIDIDLIAKITDTQSKLQKSGKILQNHTLASLSPYKTPYTNHSALPIDTLRSLPSINPMLERYPNDERYLASFSNSASSLYHDKTYQMAQMFNSNMPSEAHRASPPISNYSQPSLSIIKDSIVYKTAIINPSPSDAKHKTRRKRTSDTVKQAPATAPQTYHPTAITSDAISSVKTSMIPGSAFNFGTSSNIGLSGSLYENASFTLEELNNTANQLAAANYMAAAVAHQQRSSVDVNTEQLMKPAHQNSSHVTGSYPLIGPASPLYQQFLQRQQEELLRQTGAQIMGLYPSGYAPALGVRQPYDALNRPSWL